jgi:hypothetical protein
LFITSALGALRRLPKIHHTGGCQTIRIHSSHVLAAAFGMESHEQDSFLFAKLPSSQKMPNAMYMKKGRDAYENQKAQPVLF